MATELKVNHLVTFHGWLPRTALGSVYFRPHIMILPSDSEGWPKVLSEGMAYGIVPLGSNVGSIPQYLAEIGCGRTLRPDDIDGFVDSILWYCSNPDAWKKESDLGLKGAD